MPDYRSASNFFCDDAPVAGVVCDTASAASSGAAIGTGVATGIGIAGDVAGAAGIGAAAGIAGAIGSAIPIPGIGAAIAALAALTAAIVGALKDTFHPNAGVAEAWLWLFRAMPELTMMNVDNANDPIAGANLVRYFRIVSGEIPKGVKGNNGNLNNPNISTSCDNPYQCNVDKDEPLTDPAVLKKIRDAYLAWIPTMGPGANPGTIFDNWKPLNPQQEAAMRTLPKKIPSPYYTKKKAKAILHVFRHVPKAFHAISGWSEFSANRPQLREHVRYLRDLAGESGEDKTLNDIFGGDVTPHKEHHGKSHDHKIGEVSSVDPCPPKPSRLAWFGLGALTFAGSLVGLAVWQVRKVERAFKSGEDEAVRRIRQKQTTASSQEK